MFTETTMTREIAPFVQITLTINEDLRVSYTAEVWNNTRTDIIVGGQLHDDILNYTGEMLGSDVLSLFIVLGDWKTYHFTTLQSNDTAIMLVSHFIDLPNLPVKNPLANIRMKTEFLDYGDYDATKWKVTLSYQGRRSTFGYQMGSAHKEVKLADVVSSLQSDMSLVEYSIGDLANEFGYKPSEALRIHRAIQKEHKKLLRLFGNHYNKFFVNYI